MPGTVSNLAHINTAKELMLGGQRRGRAPQTTALRNVVMPRQAMSACEARGGCHIARGRPLKDANNVLGNRSKKVGAFW